MMKTPSASKKQTHTLLERRVVTEKQWDGGIERGIISCQRWYQLPRVKVGDVIDLGRSPYGVVDYSTDGGTVWHTMPCSRTI